MKQPPGCQRQIDILWLIAEKGVNHRRDDEISATLSAQNEPKSISCNDVNLRLRMKSDVACFC